MSSNALKGGIVELAGKLSYAAAARVVKASDVAMVLRSSMSGQSNASRQL
jgi:hypothetical protein